MKKAVIAVATVLVFIFALTQKSEAVNAADWSALSGFLGDSTNYYTDPIVLTDNITSDSNFTLLTLGADKAITSESGKSFSLTFNESYSGILALVDNRKLMFQKLNVLRFSNASASAIKNENLSLITFDSLTVDFSYNYESGGSGGAIYNDSSTVSFVNSTVSFLSNTAGYYGWSGGAIRNSGSSVSFVNSTVSFVSNTAGYYGSGGAIYNYYSTASFVNSTVSFLSNTAESGGAIANKYATVSFVNSTVSFLSNEARNGGAIANLNSAVSFVNSTVSFSNNSVYYGYGNDSKGGAIYNDSSAVSFVNSTVDFSYNRAGPYGGAIYNDSSTVSFVNSTVNFSGNSARYGGAIDNHSSTVSFVNSTVSFWDNSTGQNGGAIDNKDSSAVSFINSTVSFLSNTAEDNGGAIYNSRSSVSFVNSTVSFLDNTASYYYGSGGAIYNEEAWLVFDNSSATFLNNTATTNGGIFYNLNSTVSFTNSTVFFLNDKKPTNLDISNTNSLLSFTNSTATFFNNNSLTSGTGYRLTSSQLVFDNSNATFSANTAEYGGAIFNDANSTLIFKGGSKVVFEGNTATEGADIYNNGFIEISERSEVILRSGINGPPSAGSVINIKSGGVLTISADEIVISRLNVSAGSKFSLVDREAISKANGGNFRSSSFAGAADPDFVTLYSSKTANIDNLTVAGILEIGVDLSSDNRNDLIVADNSITFLQGSYLNIVPFNEWSSPRTYSDIFTGELVGFENLNYNHSFFVLEYDKQMNTVSLKVISDPYYHQTPDFIKAVFVANTIRHLSRFDDSSIYENANENYWGVAQIGGSELKDSVDGTFATEITGVKAGAALIKKKNLKAGVYAGYDFGETSQKVDKYEFGTHSQKTDRAEFSAFQVGAYASLLTGNINLKALSAYQAITVKAKHEHDEFSTEFGINNINFGLSAELQTGKTLTPYISLVGSNISSDEISQSSESFNLNIAANSYFTLTSKAGVQVKTKVLRAKGFLGYVLIGNDPEFELTITNNNLKTFNSSSDLANPSSEEALFFGIEGGIDLPLTRQIALVINIQTNFMPTDYIAYQASVGVKYSWNDRERKGKKGNDNGELPPAKQNGGQATTTRQPADSKAGGQEEGTYVAIFDTNSSDLSQDALLVIINVVQNALRKQYTTIIVMGFAPDSANESANRTLSGLRAMAVARELQRYGIDRNKIKIEAYGSRNPRFPANTPEGRARNQRVEIVIE